MSNEPEDISIRDLLLKIRNKEIEPATLGKETRQACVETLLLEGQQASSIAQFLKKSDRTIRRDLEEIRKGYSVNRDSGVSNGIVSDFMFNSKVSIAHLMRLARSNDGSVSDKVRAEAMAFKIHKEVIQELYYVGLLTFTQEMAKNNEQEPWRPSTEKGKEIEVNIKSISALENHILAECLLRREEGKAEKSWFRDADPKGNEILDGLIKKGVFNEYSDHEVDLVFNINEPLIRPFEIAGESFDLIWAVLRRPYEEMKKKLTEKSTQDQVPVEIKQP